MRCPKCKVDSVHRSHRVSSWERLISWVGFRPYRCLTCQYRFLGCGDGSANLAVPRGTREISATRNALRRKGKVRNLLLYGSALLVYLVILYYLTREPSMGG
jgi:hypothetical protein